MLLLLFDNNFMVLFIALIIEINLNIVLLNFLQF